MDLWDKLTNLIERKLYSWYFVSGFALGTSIKRKTNGVWIWVKHHPELEDRYLVLLDTEGLDDIRQVSQTWSFISLF